MKVKIKMMKMKIKIDCKYSVNQIIYQLRRNIILVIFIYDNILYDNIGLIKIFY